MISKYWVGDYLMRGNLANANPMPTHFADPTGDIDYLYEFAFQLSAQQVLSL